MRMACRGVDGGEIARCELPRQDMSRRGRLRPRTSPRPLPPPRKRGGGARLRTRAVGGRVRLYTQAVGGGVCLYTQAVGGEFVFAPGLGVLGEGVGLKVYNYAIFGNELFGGIRKM